MTSRLNRRHRPSILVVEDEPSYRALIELHLRRAAYRVTLAPDGHAGLEAFERQPSDLVLLDLRLPDIDGYEVCRRLRELSNVPVIMLTALDDQGHKIRGLNIGADDYITKPFDADELLARIAAVLRRTGRDGSPDTQSPTRGATTYLCGDLAISLDTPRVMLRGEEVTCTATEYQILRLLAQNAGRVVVQEELLRRVWGAGYEGDTALLQTAMWRLRRKLEDDPRAPRYLRTIRGIGYQLPAPGTPA